MKNSTLVKIILILLPVLIILALLSSCSWDILTQGQIDDDTTCAVPLVDTVYICIDSLGFVVLMDSLPSTLEGVETWLE